MLRYEIATAVVVYPRDECRLHENIFSSLDQATIQVITTLLTLTK